MSFSACIFAQMDFQTKTIKKDFCKRIRFQNVPIRLLIRELKRSLAGKPNFKLDLGLNFSLET